MLDTNPERHYNDTSGKNEEKWSGKGLRGEQRPASWGWLDCWVEGFSLFLFPPFLPCAGMTVTVRNRNTEQLAPCPVRRSRLPFRILNFTQALATSHVGISIIFFHPLAPLFLVPRFLKEVGRGNMTTFSILLLSFDFSQKESSRQRMVILVSLIKGHLPP